MNESEMAIFRRRNIGIVYQFYNLIPNLTVDENIMLPCLLDQRKPDAGKLERIVEMTGLSNRRKHLPGQLSGGQQQRVSVGRALINDPAFILADEPTGNLDSRSGREVIELLMAANRKSGQTLILITHDENIALQANRILTISDGRIIRDEVIRDEYSVHTGLQPDQTKKIQNCDHHCCDQLIHSSSHGSDQFCSKRKHYGSGISGGGLWRVWKRYTCFC